MNRKLSVFVIIISLQIFLVGFATAQDSFGDQLVVEFRDQQITLYTIDAAGEKHPMEAATRALSSVLWPQTNLLLPARNRIWMSPNGSLIAFVTTSYDDGSPANLHLYDIASDRMENVEIPAIADVYWSPNSDYIVLAPPRYIFDMPTLEDLYLYELSTKTIKQLTNTPDEQVETGITWLPDDETIVFAGHTEDCQQACTGYVENLYSISRNKGNENKLTDLGTQLPMLGNNVYHSCDVRAVAWSESDKRILYEASCDENYNLLFSTDLSGDNRLEIDLPALFPGEEQLWIHNIYKNPSTNELVVTTSGLEIDPHTGDNHERVRVLKQSTNGNVSTLYSSEVFGTFHFSSSDLSEDGNLLVMGFADHSLNHKGILRLVNLTDGTQMLERNTESSVCSVTWRQNSMVVYEPVSYGSCTSVSDSVWLWDTQNDTIHSTGIEGVVYVYPIESTIMTEPER